MIIDKTYFKGEIYIPHANPSITDGVLSEGAKLNDFIDEYERDCLIKSLGYNLFIQLENEIDITKPNKLKDSTDEKWDFLLNGHEYLKNGKTKKWKGVRFKSLSTNTNYDKSFLANYVYFYFERNYDVVRSSVGTSKPNPKNAEIVSAMPKAVTAWRKMVEMIQGVDSVSTIIERNGIVGVDWYGQGGNDISLYEFIQDMNSETPDYYKDFNPKIWKNINRFGI